MRGMFRWSLIILCCLLFTACGNNPEGKQEHVWQAQEDALKKARKVEGVMQESMEKQQQMLKGAE
jgi:hypothetical protein